MKLTPSELRRWGSFHNLIIVRMGMIFARTGQGNGFRPRVRRDHEESSQPHTTMPHDHLADALGREQRIPDADPLPIRSVLSRIIFSFTRIEVYRSLVMIASDDGRAHHPSA